MIALVLLIAGQCGPAGCSPAMSGRVYYPTPSYTLSYPVATPGLVSASVPAPALDVEKLKAELRLDLRRYAREFVEAEVARHREALAGEFAIPAVLHMPTEIPEEVKQEEPEGYLPGRYAPAIVSVVTEKPYLAYTLFAAAAVVFLIAIRRETYA